VPSPSSSASDDGGVDMSSAPRANVRRLALIAHDGKKKVDLIAWATLT
jgi:hypothetical protein